MVSGVNEVNEARTLLRTILAAVPLILCGSSCAPAQDVRYLKHQSWSTEDGLPQNSVRQIYQTQDGFLWVATEAGLARFDGLGFQVFDHQSQPAFRNDDICCLVADADGGALDWHR